MTSIHEAAEILDEAARHGRAVSQFAPDAFDLDGAYAIQAASVDRRIARGERIVGMKMGFTSRAKMVQMGVSDMIWGRLTDAMQFEDGGEIEMARFVHPRAEPEIAFLLSKPLCGVVSAMEAVSAVEAVAPAIEVIDSRYKDFKFSLTGVVADNSSSSAFVVGPWNRPDTDLSNLGMLFEVDGQPPACVSSAAILGHPVRSLVAAARLAARFGAGLEAGMIVLAGGAAAALPLAAGSFVALRVEHLGAVSFSVTEGR
jgi:2-oxo-3-hexenedioate decarboxylase